MKGCVNISKAFIQKWLILVAVLSSFETFGVNYTTMRSGTINDADPLTTPYTSTVGLPIGNADRIIINAGHTLTVDVDERLRFVRIEPGGTLSINAGVTLRADRPLILKFGNGLAGARITGAGTYRQNNVTATITYVAGGYVSGVTIDVNNFRLTQDVTFTVADDGVAANEDLIINSIITDAGNNDFLAKDGAGSLTLSGLNTMQRVELNAGRLNINGAQALGNLTNDAGAFRINGGEIDNTSGGPVVSLIAKRTQINSDFTFIGTNDLSMGTGIITLSNSFDITTDGGVLTLDGGVRQTGTDKLGKFGTGTLALTKNNTHDGTILDAGTLDLQHARAIGGTNKTLGDPALTINGGKLDCTAGDLTFDRAYRQNWNASFEFVGSNNLDMSTGGIRIFDDLTVTVTASELTINSVISDDGNNDDLTKNGPGILTLKKANSHQSTTLDAGQLNINHVRALGGEMGGPGAFKVNGGTIDNTSGADIILTRAYRQTWNSDFTFVGSNALDMSIGAVTMTANIQITTNTDGVALTQDGIIGGAFRLTKSGAGTLELNKANTFTGGVTLNGGLLNIENASSLGTIAGTFIISAGTLDNTSGGLLSTVDYPQRWNANWTFTGTNDLDLGIGTVDFTSDISFTISMNTLTVGGAINDVTFSLTKLGGGILEFETQAAALKDITITAGTFTPPNGVGVLSIAGDLANNSTFTTTTGGINFNGGSAQAISGSGSVVIFAMEKSGGGVLTLNRSVTVNNAMTMTSGDINLNGNTFTMGVSAASPASFTHGGGAGSGRFFKGTVTRFVNAGTYTDASNEGFFPFGTDDGSYRPMYLSAPADATDGGSITVSHSEADINYGSTAVSVADGGSTIAVRNNASWNISTAGMTAGTYELNIGGDGFGTIGSTGDLRAMMPGSVVGSAGANVGNLVKRTGLSIGDANGSFHIGSVDATNTPLPVELISFTVENNGNENSIHWTTGSEINNDYFIIQKSTDGIYFEDFQTIEGKGNSTVESQYSFEDIGQYGIVYYRLVQVDFDGTTIESKVEVVQNETQLTSELIVFPNPINRSKNLNLTIKTKNEIGKILLEVRDNKGRLFFVSERDHNGISNVSLPIQQFNLAIGTYFVRVILEEDILTQKIVVL